MRYLLSAILCLVLLLNPINAFTQETEAARTFPSIDELAGKNLRYKIGFLWMNRIADGFFSLTEGMEPNTYRAKMYAKTRGVAAWVTSHRIQSYESLMLKQPDGLLTTLTHDSTIERGRGKSKKIRTKHYVFDPESASIKVSKIADGALWWEKELPVDGPMPVDILTAYFNFVTGAYGSIEAGSSYRLPAFGGEGTGEIFIEVLTEEQRPSSSFFPAGGTFCRVTVDQEIFDTGDGTIYVWYDQDGTFARGVIKDIIGMGDVRGVLRK